MIIVIFCLPSFADQCSDLQKDLASIQYQLETKQLNDCSEKVKRYCKDPTDPETGKTIYQAKMEYNQALAELMLHEGLISLGAAIEDNHNALKGITSSQLQEAQNNIQDFTMAFKRGKILQKSLELNGDKSLWDDYDGEDIQSMQEYLNKICVRPKAYKAFCGELAKTQRSSSANEWEEVVKTLQGFHESDRRVLRTDRDAQYRRYQDYLKVKVGDKLVDLDQLEKDGAYKKVETLKSLIEQYKSSPSDETLKQLMKVSKEIDKIDINYNNTTGVRAKFSDFAKRSLEKEATKLHSVSGLFLNTKHTKDNFSKIQKTMDTELSVRKATLDKAIADFSSNLRGKCEGKDTLKCIKDLCNPSPDGDCTQSPSNSEIIGSGLDQIYKKVKIYNDAKRVGDAVTQVNNECFSKHQELHKVKTCAEKTLTKLKSIKESDLQKKREQLAQKKKVLDYLSNGSPIKDLEIYKAVTVNALHNSGCIKDREDQLELEFRCIQNPGIDSRKGIITLADDTKKIITDYNQGLWNRYLKDGKGSYGPEYKREREKLLRRCREDRSFSHLCKYLQEEYRIENIKVRVSPLSRQAREALTQRSGEEVEKVDGPSGWVYAGRGLATSVVLGATAWMQHDMQQTQFDAQMDGFRAQSKFNEDFNKHQIELAKFRAEQMENFLYNSIHMNWGFNTWNPYPTQLHTFNQGFNGQTFFNPSSLNFSQFTFAPTSFSTSTTSQPALTPLLLR